MAEQPPQHDKRRLASLLFYGGRHESVGGGTLADGRTLIYFGSMIVLIGLAGWLYLYQVTSAASLSYDLRQLEQRKERLHREIVAIHAQVALKGALAPALDSEAAKEYRFPKASEASRRIVYDVAPLEPLAPADAGADGGAEPVATSSAGVEGLWQRLVGQVNEWMTRPVAP